MDMKIFVSLLSMAIAQNVTAETPVWDDYWEQHPKEMLCGTETVPWPADTDSPWTQIIMNSDYGNYTPKSMDAFGMEKQVWAVDAPISQEMFIVSPDGTIEMWAPNNFFKNRPRKMGVWKKDDDGQIHFRTESNPQEHEFNCRIVFLYETSGGNNFSKFGDQCVAVASCEESKKQNGSPVTWLQDTELKLGLMERVDDDEEPKINEAYIDYLD